MKKILSVFCIATLLFASCSDEYEDSKLWQNVNDLKDRIASLEKTVQTMNSDIGSIQSIVDAINARDYIVKIEELADKSGYTITFAKGNTITIKHGKDGIDGKDSHIIGIDIYEGIYYWTITTNGNKTWLLDNDGNKLKVSGVDGKTAYDLAVEKGYKGTLEEWLESLKGSGSEGKSAYELAVEKGYEGTLDEWLESLKGSNGSDGQDGSNGKSAYELAVEKGYSGTIEEWLESLNGTDGKDGSDGENGKDGITPILGVDSEGYWTIDMGNGVQRLKDANGEDVKAIGQDGTDGKDGVDGSSFFNNVRYDDNFVYFTFTDGKTVSIPLSKGVSFTVIGVSAEQSFEYGETRTFDIVQNNIAKISISKPDGWKVSVLGDIMTVIAPPQENTFAEESGEIAITAMGTDSKSFVMFLFSVKVEPYIQFKDSKFEEYILANFDKDGNGSISQSEANEIISINCNNMGIESLDEIKQFLNLKVLYFFKNQVTSLDVKDCKNLTTLGCIDNPITSLDVSQCINLAILQCGSSYGSPKYLKSLKVNKTIKHIDCRWSLITSLDASNCIKLEQIYVPDNKLKTLSLNNCTQLKSIICYTNEIPELNIEGCINITDIDCRYNALTTLDVSGCPNLESLTCDNNPNLTLYFKTGQFIENLTKDVHTQIVYK
ncbi:MAG: hypothetical protein J6K02_07400 [Alistipes sp.]|uniref:PL29 family lyase N-terminal domain-containing protein n=3 Tax=Alistipes TaxID=239759 RepID=UPI001B6B9A38|nr:PL29 family lyase N-terminal domain-containing protein [Alistipes sp.]MBP3528478.1 hypothetical protein [Alistipes sp.]